VISITKVISESTDKVCDSRLDGESTADSIDRIYNTKGLKFRSMVVDELLEREVNLIKEKYDV
jgi:hypothetical protein